MKQKAFADAVLSLAKSIADNGELTFDGDHKCSVIGLKINGDDYEIGYSFEEGEGALKLAKI